MENWLMKRSLIIKNCKSKLVRYHLTVGRSHHAKTLHINAGESEERQLPPQSVEMLIGITTTKLIWRFLKKKKQ